MSWISTNRGRALLGMLAALSAMVAVMLLLRASGLQPGAGVRLAVGLTAAIPVIWFASVYWRSLDEASQEAQKWAWYWGGSAGMAVGFLLLAWSGERIAAVIGYDGSSPELLFAGGLTVVAAQLLGFVAAWIYWWAVRR